MKMVLLFKQFYKNGQLWVICNYINEKINGEYKIYEKYSLLEKHEIYENDIIVQTIL